GSSRRWAWKCASETIFSWQGNEIAIHQQRACASGSSGGAVAPGGPQPPSTASADVRAPATPAPGHGAAAAPRCGRGKPALDRYHLGSVAHIPGRAAAGRRAVAADDLSAGLPASLGSTLLRDAVRPATIARWGVARRPWRTGGRTGSIEKIRLL